MSIDAIHGGQRIATITKENWTDLVTAYRNKVGNPRIPPHVCFAHASVCPAGLFTDLSLALWSKYASCDGTRRMCSSEYDTEPAIYLEACAIIEPFRQTADERRNQRG